MTTKKGENLLYEKESFIIRGICFGLYKKYGGAFKESVINNALVQELENAGIKTENQKRIDILHNQKKIGVYIPDLIIENKILIELKAKPFITEGDEKQFWHYLRATDYKLGFLINFSPEKLQIKRRIYDKARKQYPH